MHTADLYSYEYVCGVCLSSTLPPHHRKHNTKPHNPTQPKHNPTQPKHHTTQPHPTKTQPHTTKTPHLPPCTYPTTLNPLSFPSTSSATLSPTTSRYLSPLYETSPNTTPQLLIWRTNLSDTSPFWSPRCRPTPPCNKPSCTTCTTSSRGLRHGNSTRRLPYSPATARPIRSPAKPTLQPQPHPMTFRLLRCTTRSNNRHLHVLAPEPRTSLRISQQPVQRIPYGTGSSRIPATMTTPVITIVPTLDVATLARIRYPSWLQSLYNAAQLQCTELDTCGAFHFVALDSDWDNHPSNVITTTTNTTIRARPTIIMPRKPVPTATGPTFARFVYDMAEFTKWEKARTSIQPSSPVLAQLPSRPLMQLSRPAFLP